MGSVLSVACKLGLSQSYSEAGLLVECVGDSSQGQLCFQAVFAIINPVSTVLADSCELDLITVCPIKVCKI